MKKSAEKIKELYVNAKSAIVGSTCKCPSCRTEFVKTNYQQTFCKSKKGTICKDKYWNAVTPEKRNNTTRIAPTSANFMATRYDHLKPNIVWGVEKFQGLTSEGYRVFDGVAYDVWDVPVYNVNIGNHDPDNS